jgi:hypothetical protein
VNSERTEFASNVLAYHLLNGDLFTITYTVNAVAEELDNVEAEDEEDERD